MKSVPPSLTAVFVGLASHPPSWHSLGWVRANAGVKGQGGTDVILDEAKWGSPAPRLELNDEQWAAALKGKGEGKREDVKFALWVPEDSGPGRGVVAITGHGSGETLYTPPPSAAGAWRDDSVHRLYSSRPLDAIPRRIYRRRGAGADERPRRCEPGR